MDFKQFLNMIAEAESTAEKDDKAEKAGKKVAKDIEYDEGHKGKDDEKAEKAGEKVKKDIEYDDKKDKKSLKDWFEIVDRNMINEAEQLTLEPAKQNTQVLKKGDEVIGTVTNPALAATIKSAISKGDMSLAGHDMKEEAEDNPESAMMEKWAGDAKVEPTGEYAGKTVEELKSMLSKLKKSGPHKEGSPGFKKMRQVMFAIRAKKGWKGGVDESAVEESGLQAYLGKKKYGKEGMAALQKAGREGASKEKMAQIRAKHDKLDEVQIDEKAKNPYAIGMAQAMKSTGDKPPLKKSTITKAHDIAKSVKKKTTEAEIPHSGPDYGAGLGAGRSQSTFEGKKPDFLDLDKDGNKKESMKKAAADKKKQKVKESMNTCEAAYHEGKAHGLTKHGYSCRYDEGSEEHSYYHRGFKEGLDECYGLMPVQGLVVGETMPAATVPGMASQAMPAMEADVEEGNAFTAALAKADKGDKFKVGGKTFTDRSNYDAEVDEDFASGAKKFMKGMGTVGRGVGTILGKTARAAVTVPAAIAGGVAGLAQAAKDGYQAGKTATGTANEALDEYAFESLDKQLNALLNEGVSVNMQKDIQGLGDDSVSVTATDDDAAKLLDFIKQVGLGGLGDEKALDGQAEPVVSVSDYGAPKFSGHDDMMSLMKVVSGDDYKDEEDRYHSHEGKMCETHGVLEGTCGCSEGKEIVDEVETEDQMLYNVAEDDGEGYEQSQASAAEIDSALASKQDVDVTEGGDGGEASEEPIMSEESKSEEDDHAEKAGKKVAKDIEHDEGHKGKDDNRAEKAGKEVTKDIEYDDKKDAEEKKLDEWANDAGKDGTDQAFQRDIEFMTKVISGGLNKPKSTGQQTIPVLAGDKARTNINDDLISEWKRLSGLR